MGMTSIIHRWESGHVLLVSLVLSMALSMLGVVAMQSGLLEARMAGTWRDREREFQNLELVLRHVEQRFLARIDASAPGPWQLELSPHQVATDMAVAGHGYPVRVTVSREPLPPPLLRGTGGAATESLPIDARYRITVATSRDDGREALSLRAISGHVAGVRP